MHSIFKSAFFNCIKFDVAPQLFEKSAIIAFSQGYLIIFGRSKWAGRSFFKEL